MKQWGVDLIKESHKSILLFTILITLIFPVIAQKKHISMKDSLDRKFDLSDYLIEANGFVPVPIILTEPAFGGFGGGLVPVFIKKRPPYLDSIKGKMVATPVAPDITGGAALYTVNNTWGTFAFRSGTFIKSRIKYMIGGGYFNLNLSFYKTFPQLGEKEMKFNLRTIPFFTQATKRIGFSKWYAGLKYLFLKTNVKFVGNKEIESLAKPLELDRTVSQLGTIIELDTRDNIFTPDNGIKVHVDAMLSDDFLGSDYDYWKLNYYTYLYKTFSPKLTTGLRLDGQQAFNDPPFYLLPFIDMRGIPIARYQGKADILSEFEMRWNVVPRWSVMLFSGAGKAFDEWSEFGDAKWVWSYGTGFRYLIARKFKLRMGVDVARGPEKWAYYIVFGSSWLK